MAKSVLQVYHVREDKGVHQTVNIRINGLPARMLIDTGASHTVFCKRRIHYFAGDENIEHSNFRAIGMGESFEAFTFPLKNFTIGKICLSTYDVLVTDLSLIERLYGHLIDGPIHGVLGGDLLTLPGSMISFRKHLLRIGGARSVKIHTLTLQPSITHLMVQLKIMGKKANMLVDTGASVTMFNKFRFYEISSFEEHLLEPVEEPCKGVKDDNSELSMVNLKEVQIGHVQLHDYRGRLLDLENVNESYLKMGYPPLDGIIGNDLLFTYQMELFPADNTLIIRS
ncbi:MAG: hypothetical protein PWR20_1678 [Bacteroidales bacterium]|jgi:predicted aspartyl protease|nr:hypothetical protein [Bacteroidales bacterium]MDN5328553.1 hypothetical protein [Bacteroidales bacterium]